MTDEPRGPLAQRFAEFAGQAPSSPLYTVLSAGVADHEDVVAILAEAPPTQHNPVLLFAAVHDLLLDEPDAELGRWYHTLGGNDRPDDIAVAAFVRFCREHREPLIETVRTRNTQTNEVGRSAALRLALASVGRRIGLVEIGASAGLNLLVDHYRYDYDGVEVGAISPLTIRCSVSRSVRPPPIRTEPDIGSRIGGDLLPLDVRNPADRRWLMACVWPDELPRFERLRLALDIAQRDPPTVLAGDAVDLVSTLSAQVDDHLVIWHSWVLPYLDHAARSRFVRAVEDIAGDRDLDWIYAEQLDMVPELAGPVPRDSLVTSLVKVSYRRGKRTVAELASMHPHGRWLTWLATSGTT